jgi:hypothetical protein
MSYIETRKDINYFIKSVVDILGGSFHIDNHFKEYVFFDNRNADHPLDGMKMFHPTIANKMDSILEDCLEFDEDYTWNISIRLMEKSLGIKPVKTKYELETYY